MSKIWIIAPGVNAKYKDECFKNDMIILGWDSVGDIKKYSSVYSIKQALQEKDPEYKDKNPSQAAKMLWDFGHKVKTGDLVIVRDGLSKIVGVGILGDYVSPGDENNPSNIEYFHQTRKVTWLSNTIKELPFQLSRNTIVDLNTLDEEKQNKIKQLIGINSMLIDDYKNLLQARNQMILQGPPGTGKTRLAKIIARKIIKNEENPQIDNLGDQIKLIQFHPSYSYEDFVRGISAKTTKAGIEYIVENKILAQMAQDALDNKDKKYILIIDEINRANLSSVLGELIYALEYRDEAVESMYALENGSRDITLPSNLYIIGTMNTADRSIGHIDYAIRRRFAFADLLPDPLAVSVNSKFKEVQQLFKNDNGSRASTLSPEFNPDDVMLGHSYFIGKDEEELEEKLKYQVIPLLKEYIKDGVLQEEANSSIEKLLNNKDQTIEQQDS